MRNGIKAQPEDKEAQIDFWFGDLKIEELTALLEVVKPGYKQYHNSSNNSSNNYNSNDKNGNSGRREYLGL